MPKAKPKLHPHQVEILKVLIRNRIPISRPELYRQLSFGNWIGKYIGTPRSPGRYPSSLYDLDLVDVEDTEGSPDERGFRCLHFFVTAKGRNFLKNSPPKKSSKQRA